MKTNVIRQRVADFLKQHTPFDSLPEADLLEIAGSGKVKFHESEEYVFRQGGARGDFVWMIQQGRVELLDESAGGERLRDVRGEGDLLGLEQFRGDGLLAHSARTSSDVILYGLPVAEFEKLIEGHASVRRYLEAQDAATSARAVTRRSWLDEAAPPLEYLRAEPEVAWPVIEAPFTTREALGAMLGSGSEALRVERRGEGVATVTARDLALFSGWDVFGVIAAIRQARSDAEMAALLPLLARIERDALGQPDDVEVCGLINAAAMKALVEACIRRATADLRDAGLHVPEAPFCWITFGAAARGDLLTLEAPTIAAVYDEEHPAFAPEDSLFFAAIAGEAAARFHALGLTGSGLVWPAGARPSMPLSEWKRFYRETLHNPLAYDLYGRRRFFDLAPLFGDAGMVEQLRECISEELRHEEAAIALLANDTLAHLPPLTFFRGLVVDLDGAHQESFDIHQAILSPIINAARVFALTRGDAHPANTLARLAAARVDRAVADAFRAGLYYRALAGGNQIRPRDLDKFDQCLLKNAFSAIQRFLAFVETTFVTSPPA